MPNIQTGSEDYPRKLRALISKKRARHVNSFMEDIQLQVDSRIENRQVHNVLMMAAGVGVPNDGKVRKLDSQQRLVFACTFTWSSAVIRRGEDCYKQRLHHRFLKENRAIGPTGTVCTYVVAKDGKHNKNGNVEYTAAAPHVDPFVDQSFWHGLLYLHLLLVAQFTFPGHDEWKQLFSLPTYPTPLSYNNHTRQAYSKLWRAFFDDARLMVSKLTHIWRVQGEKELDEMGVPNVSIKRLAGHVEDPKSDGRSKSQTLSYANNPPTDAMTERAGGDHKNPKAHHPPRQSIAVPDSLLCSIPEVKKLVDCEALAKAAMAQCKTRSEIESQRLGSCVGTLSGILNDIRNAFRALASRPVDPKSRIIKSESPILLDVLKGGSTLRDILHNPVFQSDEFLTLCSKVREAESQSMDFTLDAERASANDQTRKAREPAILHTQ